MSTDRRHVLNWRFMLPIINNSQMNEESRNRVYVNDSQDLPTNYRHHCAGQLDREVVRSVDRGQGKLKHCDRKVVRKKYWPIDK